MYVVLHDTGASNYAEYDTVFIFQLTLTTVYKYLMYFKQYLQPRALNLYHFDQCCFTFSEFKAWKIDVEKVDRAQFVVTRGSKACRGGKRSVCACSRSGTYTSPVAERKRQLKSQGSKKCSKTCPASITVTGQEGDLTVRYYPTHFGHEKSLCHLHLAVDERQQIAGN